MLAVAAAPWDEDGEPVLGELGELVITEPMPSMPLHFWNDPTATRYREAYFEPWPGVWRHGDWLEITPRGTCIITGRSDSTLNRGGVRMGTADIYAAVESIPAVLDCVVLGVEQPDGGYWMPLFVQLAPGEELTDELQAELKAAIRVQASPRHVPDEIIAVPGVPHTRTGKRLEVPLKRLFQGVDPAKAVNIGAVDDAPLVEHYIALAKERASTRLRVPGRGTSHAPNPADQTVRMSTREEAANRVARPGRCSAPVVLTMSAAVVGPRAWTGRPLTRRERPAGWPSRGRPRWSRRPRRWRPTVPHDGDAADDPAVWVNPDDPSKSVIVGTDKEGGLMVYDLAGRQLQYLPVGDMNNVDVRPAADGFHARRPPRRPGRPGTAARTASGCSSWIRTPASCAMSRAPRSRPTWRSTAPACTAAPRPTGSTCS